MTTPNFITFALASDTPLTEIERERERERETERALAVLIKTLIA